MAWEVGVDARGRGGFPIAFLTKTMNVFYSRLVTAKFQGT